MRCIVEGYGSIGARHAGLLADLGHEVCCVSHRDDVPFPVFQTAERAVREFSPELYLIATATARHMSSLRTLEKLGYAGRVLLEKPLGCNLWECGAKPPFEIFIAYNMRWHPLVRKMKAILGDEPVVAARLSVGQYLPDWRPGRDYSATYSAIRSQGGGVLRDLSHELDLTQYFFGPCQRLTARIGKFSSLKIDTEDWVDILLAMENCPAVTIHLDYLDRNPHRHFVITTNTRTISADLWNNTLTVNGFQESFTIERNDSFREQLRKIVARDYAGLCSWEEGMHVMWMMAAAENSATSGKWIERA